MKAAVFTHRRPRETASAVGDLVEAAARAGAELLFDAVETEKLGIEERPGLVCNCDDLSDVDLCLALGGDGTILTALRRFAGREVPVFAVNFGEVGFLATVDPNGLAEAFDRAFSGDFETLAMPTITVGRPEGSWDGLNDISVHRKAGMRVAELAYALAGEEVGRVRCDGLVVATPAGSTGYNLANGGPVMAWGVEGFVVSFIAPHSLTARALVVAPNDTLTICNQSRDGVDVIVDGRPVWELKAGESVSATFADDVAALAQVPGSTFYRRLREKFGRLSS